MWTDGKVLVLEGDREQVDMLYNALLESGMQPFDFENPDTKELTEQILNLSENFTNGKNHDAMWHQQSASAQYAGWNGFETVKKVLVMSQKVLNILKDYFSRQESVDVILSHGQITELKLTGRNVAQDFLSGGYLDAMRNTPILTDGRLIPESSEGE